MKRDKLLELIWSETLEHPAEDDHSPLAKILACLLERPVVGLIAHDSLDQPMAMFESDDLLPGTTLSDVLEEELSIEIEDGSLVIFEPAQFASADAYSGRELGVFLGRVLVDLAGYHYDIDDSVNRQNLIDAMNMTVFKKRPAFGHSSSSRANSAKITGTSGSVHYLV